MIGQKQGDLERLRHLCPRMSNDLPTDLNQVLIPFNLHSRIMVSLDDREKCSDITNTLVGISGETVPEGENLRIYCVQW